MGFWHVIDPAERRNLLPNPSLELGTWGYGTITSGTVGTLSGSAYFGAWAGSVATGSNGTAGLLSGTFTSTTGVDYTWSFYANYPDGTTFVAGVGDNSGNSLRGSIVGTGYGRWARYVGSFNESAGGARRIAIRKNSITGGMFFQVDGLQVEVGILTTYVDGDRPGCVWDGVPHLSSSYRPGTVRSGGSAIPLSDIGVYVMESPGAGMADVENIMQSYAVLDGAYYQRSRASARSLTLVLNVQGTTWQHYHAQRQRLISLVRPDRVAAPQPVRLLYTGAGGTSYIDAVYDSGLQMGKPDGFAETLAMRLVAPDPYWYSEQEEGTALAPFVSIGSMNYIAYRPPTGQWGTLGVNGTTVNGIVYALALNAGGSLFVGGSFTSAGGTTTAFGAVYANGSWGTLTNGTVSSAPHTIYASVSGSVYFGGSWTTVAGTTSPGIAVWNGAWGTLEGGTLTNGTVFDITQVSGTLFVGGRFIQAGGTNVGRVALHTGAQWGTLAGGLLTGTTDTVSEVRALAWDTRLLWLAGGFGSVAGTANANNIAYWNGTGYGTTPNGLYTPNGGSVAYALAVFPNAQVAAGGVFGTVGGVVNRYAGALVSPTSVIAMGALQAARNNTPYILDMAVIDRRAWAAGYIPIDSTDDSNQASASLFALWTGAAWAPGDIIITRIGAKQGNALARTPDGGLYIGGDFSGSALVPNVASFVLPPGMADSPVRLVLRMPTSGTARIYQINNITTQSNIWMNLVMTAGEVITMDVTPGSVSFTSNARGNIISSIIPGSNPASWRLSGGTNFISFLADNPNLRADLIASPRFWSADGTL